MRGIRLHQNLQEAHQRSVEAVTVPVRGIRLHLTRFELNEHPARVTVPVRGMRLHPKTNWMIFISRCCYCPREGYEVASIAQWYPNRLPEVTVPVRGIRLHLDGLEHYEADFKLLSP